MALDILHRRAVPPAVFVKHQLVTPDNVNHIYPNDELMLTARQLVAQRFRAGPQRGAALRVQTARRPWRPEGLRYRRPPSTSTTSSVRGPWTPLTRVISISAVAEGPEIVVISADLATSG